MNTKMYNTIEAYMLTLMNDAAHDCQHIYRVLYFALDIAKEHVLDQDVLIAAALLHDIGREAQYNDPKCDHALVGAEMAYDYLISIDWDVDKASHVKTCISTHRYRNNNPPESIEARILFDADKLDATGTIGIARTLIYQGIVSNPLYALDEQGNVLEGNNDEIHSFFREYNWKLKNIYEKFFTNRAKMIAQDRQNSSIHFYENMFKEVHNTHKVGVRLLKDTLEVEYH